MSKKNKGINILFSALTIIIHASGLGSPYEPVHVYAVKDNHVQRLHVSMFVKGVRKSAQILRKRGQKLITINTHFGMCPVALRISRNIPFGMGRKTPRILKGTAIFPWARKHQGS